MTPDVTDEPIFDQDVVVTKARLEVEGWLKETIGVGSYNSSEIIRRLTKISGLLPEGDNPAQNAVTAWLALLEPDRMKRGMAEVQNPLLDLWALLP